MSEQLHPRLVPTNCCPVARRRHGNIVWLAAKASFAALVFGVSAEADWPKPINPAQSDFPRAVTVAPPSAVPSVVSAVVPTVNISPMGGAGPMALKSAPSPLSSMPTTVGGDEGRALSLPPLMQLMQSGQLPPRQAWEDKLIGADDLLWLFDKHIQPWGRFGGTTNVPVRRELMQLLVEQGGDKWQTQASIAVRLWLADYYLGRDDARCVALCEEILREVKGPLQGDQPVAFLAAEFASRFYAARGEEAKGAQYWLRVPDYYPAGSWWISDALIEAARQFRRAGNEQRAGEIFRRVMEIGGDFFGSGALKEQAAALVGQGKRDEARRWLEQWLEQFTAQKPLGSKAPGSSDSQYLAALSQLGYVHYLDGDWGASRRCYETAVAAGQKLAGVLALHDRSVLHRCEAMLSLLANWERERMVCDPPRIHITAGREKKVGPITRRFLVSAPQETTLQIGCSDPQIKVLRVEDSPWGGEVRPLRSEKQVVIEIAAEALQNDREATLLVTSPQLPNYRAQVPLRVEMRKETP